ncbi:MAG TPA: alpha/beta fold hydrolase [Burkholderiaceae bacterium]|nr:alpha/beta fold hydrolase [Burkholderiaceae bacterium]
MRNPLRVFLVLLVLFVVATSGCASLDQWQRNAIFQTSAAASRFPFDSPPAEIEAFDLHHSNGDVVHAWYMPAGKAGAPTALFLHGARRNLVGSVSHIEHWHSLGFNVLAIDYRGFGRSTMLLPSEKTALADASLAVAELKRREPDAGKRFLYGYSLGGAVAIAMAAEHDGFAGVIIESSFTSVADLVRQSRWGWVPGLGLLVTQSFDSAERIRKVNEPLLFIHGTSDNVVPHGMSDQLLADAITVRAEYKHVVKIEGGHHGTIFLGGPFYDQAVRNFARTATEAAILGAGVSVSAVAH